MRLTSLCLVLCLVQVALGLRERRKSRARKPEASSAKGFFSPNRTIWQGWVPDWNGRRMDCSYPDLNDCSPDQVIPTIKVHQEEYFNVYPGGETACLNGQGFYFTVRKKNPTKLNIHFQAGGACWGIVDDPLVGEPDNLLSGCSTGVKDMAPKGAFSTEDNDNPWKDYSFVLISYCSGDILAGHADHPWGERPNNEGGLFSRRRSGPRKNVKVRGYNNALVALQYALKHFSGASQITLSGGSAGSLALVMWAPWVIDQFNAAGTGPKDFMVLRDSFIGVMHPIGRAAEMEKHVFDIWGLCDVGLLSPEHTERCRAGTLPFEDVFTHNVQTYSNVRWAVLSAKRDIVQIEYARAYANDFGYEEGTRFNAGEFYRDASLMVKRDLQFSNYWNYFVAGPMHVFTYTDGTMSLTRPEGTLGGVGGDDMRMSEWLKRLINPEMGLPPHSMCHGDSRAISWDTKVFSQDVWYCAE